MSGAGLPRATSSVEHRRRKSRTQASGVEHRVDQRPGRRTGQPEGEPLRHPPHRVHRAGQQRQVLAVPVRHGLDDHAGHLRRGQPDAESGAEVPRPLPGAHAHQPVLRIRIPVPAVGGDHPPPHVLPHRLGVDQHPVQVEHDRLDHHVIIQDIQDRCGRRPVYPAAHGHHGQPGAPGTHRPGRRPLRKRPAGAGGRRLRLGKHWRVARTVRRGPRRRGHPLPATSPNITASLRVAAGRLSAREITAAGEANRTAPDEQRLLDTLVREAVGAWKAVQRGRRWDAIVAVERARRDLGPGRRALLERLAL